LRAGAGTRPYDEKTLFAVGAGPRTGPSHARAENEVVQPSNSLASGNLLKGNLFTAPSEVENSLGEKCGLSGFIAAPAHSATNASGRPGGPPARS